MRRLAVWPLAWGLGLAAGVGLAALLGPYGPSWGVASAFVAIVLVFSVGSFIERDGEELTHLLRASLGFTLGFLVLTVPLTLLRLDRMVGAASAESAATVLAEVSRMRAQLLARWLVIALAVPGGAVTLVLRRGRGASGPPP